MAVRADEVSRMPWHDAWEARNEITRMLPLVTSELTGQRRGSDTARNQRSFG